MTGGLRHDGDDDNFVIVPRPTIRDDRLSFRARGLLAFILDLPDGWDIKASWLAKQGKEGEEAVYTALRELRTFGYYRVELRKGEGGRWINGTAIRKRPSAQWAAQYALEIEARAAKRRISPPTWSPGEDQPTVTDGNNATTPADSGVSGNREAPDGSSGNRIPPSPKEEQERRSEEGTPLPTGEGAHAGAHTREADDEQPQLALVGAPTKRGKTKRSTRSLVPADWTPSPELCEWTTENAPGMPRSEVAAFIDKHRSIGNTFVDFDAAWRTWARNWIKFGGNSRGARSGRPQPYRNPPEEPTQESLRAGWESAGTTTTVGGNW